MKFFTSRKSWILFAVLVLSYGNRAFAQCGFTALQTAACQGYLLNVQDTSHGAGNSAHWTVVLPNGDSLFTTNYYQFSHQMTVPGVVHVYMTDTVNGQPCSAQNLNVQVFPNPVLAGSFSTTVTCVGDCVYWLDASTPGTAPGGISCTMSSFIIDWNNSQPFDTIESPNQCARFPSNAVYPVTFVLKNSCGCRIDTTISNAITVTAPPSAIFTGTNLNTCTSPTTSTMTVTTPVANTKYSWYVSSGGAFGAPVQSSGASTFTNTYAAGTYNIELIATDTLSGCTDTLLRTAYLTAGTNAAACFTANDTTGCSDHYVSFCPCTVGASTYAWNFTGGSPGDYAPASIPPGPSSACQNVYYYNPGVFTAQLIVTYAGGCSDTLTRVNYMKFGRNYNLAFTSPDTLSCLVPDSLCVTYTGESCPSCTFTWVPTPNTPVGAGGHGGACFDVSAYGQISPELIVQDTAGCTTALVKTNYFTISPVVVNATISYYSGNGCANDTIVVTNTSTGGPFTSVNWNFPGATVISTTNTQALVKYAGSGCNDFTMVVHSQYGCIDTLRDSICIGSKPVITMAIDSHYFCYGTVNEIFSVTSIAGTDTPTSVIVWPEGLSTRNMDFVINRINLDSASYTYQDYGNFAFCFLAKNSGCLGDTICQTASADSVHVYPPIPKFNALATCSHTNTVTYNNLSLGADSTYWTFNGVHYPGSSSLTVTFPTCGTSYPIGLTAINDTFGCSLTKWDSTASVPCYGIDFRFAKTKGCDYAYSDSAYIFKTLANTIFPTAVHWDAEIGNTLPTFLTGTNGLYGDTVPGYPLYLPGVYTAYVQLTFPNGCIDTLSKPAYIDISQPNASYTPSDSAGCLPFCVTFTNTSTVTAGAIAHFYWTFGDAAGTDSVDFNPSHCYTTVGQFTACLTIVDTNGCTSSYCKQLQSNSIHANFTGDTLTCTQNPSPLNPVTYTDSSTGFVAHHQWILPASLGPVPATVGDVTSITEQFTNQGCDSIGMVAIDQFGVCRDTVWKHVCVVNPVASYSLTNLNDTSAFCPPITLCFLDSSRNNICQYNWEWADGSPTDTAEYACHIFSYPGGYPVKLIVTSCHGCTDTSSQFSIHIGGPTVTASLNIHRGCPCTTVDVYTRSANADSLQVSSNGGAPSFITRGIVRGTVAVPTVDTFTFLYCNVGTYTPEVDAVDVSNNCVVRYPNLVAGVPVDTPATNFTYHVSPCGVDSVCFTNTTVIGAPTAYDSTFHWTFGDGGTSDSANPCHHYAAPGDYLVSLTVMDNVGCSSTKTEHVHVLGAPHAYYTVDDTLGCSPFVVHFTDSSSVDDSTTITHGYWNIGNGVFLNTTADTSYNYTVGGVYTATLVITDGYGCTDSSSRTIHVQGPPTITIGPAQTICIGDTATLSGSGNSRLVWLTDYNISDTLSGTPQVWPQVDTSYVLQIGILARCYVYDTVHIFVSTISITQDTAENVCAGSVTAFTSSASAVHSTVSNYNWSYGDGASSVGQNTTHKYNTFGTYSDTLIVTSALGCKDTAVRSVTIVDVPHASFTLSIDTICPGAPITVTNTSTQGAGAALSTFTFYAPPVGSSTTSPSQFSYPTPGNDTIYLYQTDLNQCADTAKQPLYIYALPVSYNIDTPICPGATITLQAIGSNTVLWSPNTNISSTTSVTPQVNPSVNTQYIAQVGALAACYVYDTVNVIIATVTITADSSPAACLNQATTFTASAQSIDATISSYDWTFGDGHTGTGATTTHQYTSYGTFNDVLIVTSSRGCKDTALLTNIVYDIPHAAISLSADSVCLGGSVTATNLSTAGASAALTTFYFNFGFPPNPTSSPASYTYTVPGAQTILVVQTDANGCIDTAKANFIVHALPVADFNNDTSCINTSNQYLSSTVIGDGPITFYNWSVNGNALGIDSNLINYTFPDSGTENICLTVTDVFGCTSDTCQNVVILLTPPVTITPQDTTICAGYSDTVNITGDISTVQWVPSTWVSNPTGTSVTITPEQTMRYQVYLYYRNCIPKVDTVTVWVIDSVPVSATADPQNIVLGLSSNVTSEVKGTIDSIVWNNDSTLSCRNCYTPIATPTQTTTYTATVYYSKNNVVCSNTTSVTVTVYQSCNNSLIYVPNTFTPNNDGVDDVFRLRGQQGSISLVNYFRIYDRWGKLVYEADNVDDPDNAAWNGGLNNDLSRPVNTGVFVYVFEIKCVTGQTVTGKGNITLLR